MRRLDIDPLSSAFFATITIAAFVLARARPTWAVALLFFTDEIEWTHVHGGFSLSVSVLVSSAVGIAFLTQPKLLRTLRRPAVRIVGIGFGAMAIAMALSAFGAHDRGLVFQELLKLLEYAITFLMAHAAFAAERNDRLVFTSVALVAAFVSIGALAQLFTGAPSGFPLGSTVVPRIAGLLAGPNQLAGYLGLLLPVLLLGVLEWRSRLAIVSLVVLGLALLATLSRGGAIGAAVASLVVLQARPLSARLRGALFACIGAVAALGVLAFVSGTFARIVSADEVARPDGLGTRTQLWHAAIALFRSSPLVGVGAGNFEVRLASVGYPELRTHANSWLFETLADGGIVLLAATAFLIRQAVVAVGDLRSSPLALAASAATAGFVAHGLFDDLVFYPTVAGTWWLIVGVAAGSRADGENRPRSENPTAA